ncbi:kinetochore-associated Ndc80 complex subunit spc24 [Mortierella sp. GBA30]|nr:kinetochore-associated Ndc80 complex subunit spc24 [Mortierella sp. GBA30]
MEESISTLIQDVTSQFHRSNADVQSVQKTAHDIHETERTQLSRKLQLSKSKGSRQHVDPDSLRHVDRMLEMDQHQFALAKSIQDLDQDIASLEAELRQLREQNLELDVSYSSTPSSTKTNGATSSSRARTSMLAENGDKSNGDNKMGSRTTSAMDADAEDDEEETDRTLATAVLRLQLYRGLGIEMLENEFGEYTRARIRSSSRKDVHVATLGGDLSAFYQTNLIWDFAS